VKVAAVRGRALPGIPAQRFLVVQRTRPAEPSDRRRVLPNSSARLRPYICLLLARLQPVQAAAFSGAGAWRPFLLRLRNVPLMGR
jgi:hypothetical protein